MSKLDGEGPILTTETGSIRANYHGWYQEVSPCEKVWEGVFPTDALEREVFFRREGFLVFRNLLASTELEDLRAEAKRFERNYRTVPHVREGYDLEPIQDPLRSLPTFRKIGGICTLSELFERLMLNTELLDLMHRLIGPNVSLFLDAIYPKPARVGREKPWHQDQAFWKWEPKGVIVQTMTALADCTIENSCLQLIPRSHGEFLPHTGREACLEIRARQSDACYVPMKAGDVLVFSSLLLHASEPNRSEHDRSSVFIAYAPSNIKYVGKGTPHELIPISSQSE